MAVDVLPSNVGETSTSPGGTGDLDLEGAVDASYQTFAASSQIADGETTVAAIFNQDTPGEWEISEVKYVAGAPDVIQRQTVLLSSNGGSLVSFTNGDTLHIEVEAEGRQLGLVFAKRFTSTGSLLREVSTPSLFTVVTDVESLTNSVFKIDVDGSKVAVFDSATTDTRIVRPTSSVELLAVSFDWDFTGISFVRSTGVTGTDNAAIRFKPDGTKMFLEEDSNRTLYEYVLSTAWDISTASQNASVGTDSGDPLDAGVDVRGIAFKPDGTKMFLVNRTDSTLHEYDLSTAWDITTATKVQSVDISTNTPFVVGIDFSDDGTIMYAVARSDNNITRYDLSTAWDVSTVTHAQTLDVSGQDGTPEEVFVNPIGSTLYMVGNQNDNLYEYRFSTDFDLSTATFEGSFDLSGQTTDPQGLHLRESDGAKMYISGGGTAYEYDVTNDSIFDGSVDAMLIQEV